MSTQVYGNGTNSSQGENTIKHFYDRAGIKAANRVNVYGQWADRKQMPKRYGKTFKISKYLHMYDRAQDDGDFASKGYMTGRDLDTLQATLSATDGTGVKLTEGAGATNQRSLTKVTVEAALARYGEMTEYTDEVDLFSEDIMQVRYREELGELANSRYEDLIQLDLLATTTKLYAGTATSMDTLGQDTDIAGANDDTWKVSYDLIRKSARKLLRNRAKKNKSIVTGSTKVDTKTIANAYYAIIDADVKSDLESLVRGSTYTSEYVYVPAHKYGSASSLAENEVGAMHETRFIESEAAVVEYGKGAIADGWYGTEGDDTTPVTTTRYATEAAAIAGEAGNAAVSVDYTGTLAHTATNDDGSETSRFDVHPILFPTEGSFATVGLKGMNKIKFNSKKPNDIDLTNPYGTKGFFSYNFFYATVILEPEKLLRVDALVSK